MRNGKCVIVGLDGFDPDVLANLVLFYSSCGFDVSSAPAPVDCDLLVIQRGTYKNETFETRALECHIYDYAWTGTSDYHQSFPNIPSVAVISPSSPASGATPPRTPIESFHPVVPELWMNRDADIRRAHRFVHVGHRKVNRTEDRWLLQMDAVARSGRCEMWGMGWQELTQSATMHEPATLHQCQGIYRQAEFAFGVMYPFQRHRTISGRAWQGPLNGCVVLSEAPMPDVTIPGVELREDFVAALEQPSVQHRRSNLVREAAQFWDDVNNRLATHLGLRYARPTGSMVRSIYAKTVFLRHINSKARHVLRRA